MSEIDFKWLPNYLILSSNEFHKNILSILYDFTDRSQKCGNYFCFLLVQNLYKVVQESDVGIVVSIAAFQAVDPGSIPGHRKWTFCIAMVIRSKANSV